MAGGDPDTQCRKPDGEPQGRAQVEGKVMAGRGRDAHERESMRGSDRGDDGQLTMTWIPNAPRPGSPPAGRWANQADGPVPCRVAVQAATFSFCT